MNEPSSLPEQVITAINRLRGVRYFRAAVANGGYWEIVGGVRYAISGEGKRLRSGIPDWRFAQLVAWGSVIEVLELAPYLSKDKDSE